MVNFCKSNWMIKISGKVDKSNTYNRFSSNELCRNISFFERNITTKPDTTCVSSNGFSSNISLFNILKKIFLE